MTSSMDAALAYAAKGIPVFPCKNTPDNKKTHKAPHTQNGFHDATTDPAQIEKWFTKWPDALIGMPCGRSSGILVVDIDRHPGKPSGFEHVPNWAELSDHIVKTAGDGRHLYHADDGKTAVAHPFPGVEVRGEGHYAILAGSPGYEVEHGGILNVNDLKPVPEFLLKNGRTTSKARSPRRREKPIPPSLLKLCDGHWGKGVSTDKDDLPDFALIVQAINLIPNPNLPWGEWKRIVMAIWAAFLGNDDGLAAAHALSRKSSKYDAEGTDQAWDEVTGSPPSDLSAGTLIYMADQASPGWRAESDDPEPDASEQPEPDAKAEGPSAMRKRLLVTSAEFVANFVPPDYLIDGVIRRHFFYSMTAPTGHGKTALALTVAAHVITGAKVHDHEVEQGKVLFMAGENVEDVQARWIALCEARKIEPNADMVFMPGVKQLTNTKFQKQFLAEAEELGPFALLIVDTSAAYSEVDEENSNAQMGEHARLLRSFSDTLSGKPTVIALCHPTKNANPDCLLPRGGGAFVAEVDGNLVCKMSTGTPIVDLHWQGKFRGVEFAPLSFELVTHRSDRLKDSKGRHMPTVIARPISDEEKEGISSKVKEDQHHLMRLLLTDSSLSLAKLAEQLGWMQKDGKPYKAKVDRLLRSLKARGMVDHDGDDWVVTKKGEKAMKADDVM